MPAYYQGTQLDSGSSPIANLHTPAASARRDSRASSIIGPTESTTSPFRLDQTELDARIKSYELAFRMQAEAPEAVDLASRDSATQLLYGLDDPATDRMDGCACWLGGWSSGACVHRNLLRSRQQVGCTQRHRGKPCPNLRARWIARSRDFSRI